MDDPHILLVHVTHFNHLMWDNGRTPTRVIEHGVLIPEGVRYTGELEGHYRFVFNPIRYTSLGLVICEAMMVGMPIIGLATTEMVTAIRNGVSGYVDTEIDRLIAPMRRLLASPLEAQRLSAGARLQALQRFNIQRFVSDWNDAFASVVDGVADGFVDEAQELGYEKSYSAEQ